MWRLLDNCKWLLVESAFSILGTKNYSNAGYRRLRMKIKVVMDFPLPETMPIDTSQTPMITMTVNRGLHCPGGRLLRSNSECVHIQFETNFQQVCQTGFQSITLNMDYLSVTFTVRCKSHCQRQIWSELNISDLMVLRGGELTINGNLEKTVMLCGYSKLPFQDLLLLLKTSSLYYI